MRNTIYRILYAAVLFCVAFLLMEVFAAGTSTQTTTEMSAAVLPVVSMDTGSTVFNTLYGLTQEQDPGQMRTVLTPIDSDRTIGLQIRAYGQTISALSMEVRDITGDRLIEQEAVEVTGGEDSVYSAQLTFKNLISPDTEYMLVLRLSTEDTQDIRYYTRFVYTEDNSVSKEAEEALTFARVFHDKTFDKTAEDYLLTYLEPSDDVSNSSLASVTLYNSADAVTWGDLNPTEVTSPVYSITDREGETFGIRGTYYVSAPAQNGEPNQTLLFRCEEFYELRKGTDRFYLMDYERTMSQDFDPQHPYGTSGGLTIGITSSQIQTMRNAQRSVTVFVQDGRLYEYSQPEDLLIYIFGFDEAGDTGERETHAEHDIRILHVEEDGSTDFLVYGYMNSGRHEGKIGVSFYHYSGEYHTMEEKVFVPCSGSWERLKDRIDQISHYDVETGKLYLILDNALYEIDVNVCSLRLVEGNLAEKATVIASNGVLVAYAEEEQGQATGRIILVNLNGLNKTIVEPEAGSYAVPLGFLGQDLVYGTTSRQEELQDVIGTKITLMEHVYIVDQELNVLEDYHQEGYYVTGCEVRDNQLVLDRVQKDTSEGASEMTYVPADPDTITSADSSSTASLVQSISSSGYGTLKQLSLGVTDWSDCQYMRPQEILYEGSRELSPRSNVQTGEGTQSANRAETAAQDEEYFIYSCKEYLGSTDKISTAIELADQQRTGVVVNESGQYIWKNTTVQRVEIEGLTNMEDAASLENAQAACLKAMLTYAAPEMTKTDIAGLLEEGKSVLEILSDALDDARILDLTACSMDEVLYYVEQGSPVYAAVGDKSAVLIVGYGPENIEVYDPAAGSVHLLARSAASELFENAGNQFISYK